MFWYTVYPNGKLSDGSGKTALNGPIVLRKNATTAPTITVIDAYAYNSNGTYTAITLTPDNTNIGRFACYFYTTFDSAQAGKLVRITYKVLY